LSGSLGRRGEKRLNGKEGGGILVTYMFGSKVKGIDFEIISKSHDTYIPVRLKEVLTPTYFFTYFYQFYRDK